MAYICIGNLSASGAPGYTPIKGVDYWNEDDKKEVVDMADERIDIQIAKLVNSAPETLDTLGELAEALQENQEVVDVLNEAIATKYSNENPPPYPVTSVQGKAGDVVFTTETWVFTLEDGTEITKTVILND